MPRYFRAATGVKLDPAQQKQVLQLPPPELQLPPLDSRTPIFAQFPYSIVTALSMALIGGSIGMIWYSWGGRGRPMLEQAMQLAALLAARAQVLLGHVRSGSAQAAAGKEFARLQAAARASRAALQVLLTSAVAAVWTWAAPRFPKACSAPCNEGNCRSSADLLHSSRSAHRSSRIRVALLGPLLLVQLQLSLP